MHRTIEVEPDWLDDALDGSAILLHEPNGLEAELNSMLDQVAQAASVRSKRRIHRRVVSGVLAGLFLGGTGVAAAAAVGGWSWWAEDPDLSYAITLPSGVQCDIRYGLMSTQPGTVGPIDSSDLDPGLASWLATTDVLALADINGALKQMESGDLEPTLATLDDGAVTAQQGGWANFTGDQRYGFAVEIAVAHVISAETSSRGLPGIAYATENQCVEVAD